MYKLEFTLKQHTPIIHFQHDQDGATLRATEVKPKLDRFILMKLGKEAAPQETDNDKIYEIGHKKAKENGWLIDVEKRALDYKMKIIKNNKNNTNVGLDFYEDEHEKDSKKKWKMKGTYPLLLANMGGKPLKSELKDLIMYDNLSCEIVSSNKTLKDEIEKLLCSFFASNNFGNRNNKGFGSFSICQIYDKDIQLKSTLDLLDTFATLKINTDKTELYESFIAAEFLWKLIKSGINYSKCVKGKLDSTGYEKSVLLNHMKEKYKSAKPEYTWEKRWIKENYMGFKPLPYKEATFARGILGLSDKFEYKAQIKDCNTTYSKQKPFYNFTINISNNDIDRIASPFRFKIIKNSTYTIYVLIDDNFNNLEIFEKPFKFQLSEIKDFKLITGYDNIKKQPKFSFIKPNKDFNSINKDLIESAKKESEIESKKTRPKKGIVYQLQRLEDYCYMTQHFASLKPNLGIHFTLSTPKKGCIDLKEILKQFHKQYPNFIARDYSGLIKIKCSSTML